MKKYSGIYFTMFLFFAINAPAQLKVNPVVKKPAAISLPYQVPAVENKSMHVTPMQIVPKRPGIKEVKPQFSVHSASEQCALLNAIQPILELDGERTAATLVNLEWVAKELYDKKGFEIQRSFSDTNNFKTVAFVPAYANASAREEYKLADMNERIQPAYYRLKQLRLDTGYAYSNIILVKGMPQCSIFPNPVADILYLNLQSVNNCAVSIIVYDSKGVLLVKKSGNLVKDIINHQSLNVHALPAGIYNIQVAGKDTTLYAGKFIKQ